MTTQPIENTLPTIQTCDIERRIDDLSDLVDSMASLAITYLDDPDEGPQQIEALGDCVGRLWDELQHCAHSLTDEERERLTAALRLAGLDNAEPDSDCKELATLLNLREQAQPYCDWRGGAALVAAEHLPEYVQEWATEAGEIDPEHPLYAYIDWREYAKDFAKNCAEVEFDGVAYYVV